MEWGQEALTEVDFGLWWNHRVTPPGVSTALEISRLQLWAFREINSKDVCLLFLFHSSLPTPIPVSLTWMLALINTIIYSSCFRITKKTIPDILGAGCLPWDVVPKVVQASLTSLSLSCLLLQWSGPRWWGRSWWRRGPLAHWSTPSSRWRWVTAAWSQDSGGFGFFLSESWPMEASGVGLRVCVCSVSEPQP